MRFYKSGPYEAFTNIWFPNPQSPVPGMTSTYHLETRRPHVDEGVSKLTPFCASALPFYTLSTPGGPTGFSPDWFMPSMFGTSTCLLASLVVSSVTLLRLSFFTRRVHFSLPTQPIQMSSRASPKTLPLLLPQSVPGPGTRTLTRASPSPWSLISPPRDAKAQLARPPEVSE